MSTTQADLNFTNSIQYGEPKCAEVSFNELSQFLSGRRAFALEVKRGYYVVGYRNPIGGAELFTPSEVIKSQQKKVRKKSGMKNG